MGSLIYIAVIILIAIFTNVNKAAKNKKKPNARGGMPTFGGGGDNPLRRVGRPDADEDKARSAGTGSGFPAPEGSMSSRDSSSYERHEHELAPAWEEPPQIPTPDYETGEGMSYEQPAEQEDSVQARTERMQRELERLQAAYDGMAAYGLEKAADGPAAANLQGSASTSLPGGAADSRQALRNGIIWAEILGPPRSRRPHSTRR